MIGIAEEIFLQFGETEPDVNRHAVTDHMQIACAEVDDTDLPRYS